MVTPVKRPAELAADRPHRSRSRGAKALKREPGIAEASVAPPEPQLDADEQELADRRLALQLHNEMMERQEKVVDRGQEYIDVDWQEIIGDYPTVGGGASYAKRVGEEDELDVVWDPALLEKHTADWERIIMTDFAVYDAEGMLAPLELVPMIKSEPNNVLFLSGAIQRARGEDDFYGHGFECGEATDGAGEAGASDAGAGPSGSGGIATRIFTTPIREWTVEIGIDRIYIIARTNCAWYQLSRPLPEYARIMDVPVKVARIGKKLLGLVCEARRASSVSLRAARDVIAAEKPASSLRVSPEPVVVERFLVVHGAIIAAIFYSYPVEEVQRCALVKELINSMKYCRHHKVFARRGGYDPGLTVENPMKRCRGDARPKLAPMEATATLLVRKIWQSYFDRRAKYDAKGKADIDPYTGKRFLSANDRAEIERGVHPFTGKPFASDAEKQELLSGTVDRPADDEDGDAGAPDAEDEDGGDLVEPMFVADRARANKGVAFVGEGEDMATRAGTRRAYREATLGDGKGAAARVKCGTAVRCWVRGEDADGHEEWEVVLGLVQCMWAQARSGKGSRGRAAAAADGDLHMAQLRVLLPGAATVLGDTASSFELFLGQDTVTVCMDDGTERLDVEWGDGLIGVRHRKHHNATMERMQDEARERIAAGQEPTYYVSREYVASEGMFRDLPEDVEMRLGEYCEADVVQPITELWEAAPRTPGRAAFTVVRPNGKRQVVQEGDFVYLEVDAFEPLESAKDTRQRASYPPPPPPGQDAKGAAAKPPAREPAKKEKKPKKAPAKKKAPAAPKAAKPKAEATPAPARPPRAARPESLREEDTDTSGEGSSDGSPGLTRAGRKHRARKAADPDSAMDLDDAPRRRAGPRRPLARKDLLEKGSNEGVRAWNVGRVDKVTFGGVAAGSGGKKLVARLTVTRLLRPEDVEHDLAYKMAYNELLWSDETAELDPEEVLGVCYVTPPDRVPAERHPDLFVCAKKHVSTTLVAGTGPGTGKPARYEHDLTEVPELPPVEFIDAKECLVRPEDVPAAQRLKTLDIFAGCGGLSAGFDASGATETKWAIEYERSAAKAFERNYPDATMFAENCNVVLLRAMEKAGCMDECHAPEPNRKAAEGFPAELVDKLPKPGEVDFVCGGPPCQGYSGMNRFNKGNWSMVQNSMIMSYLSYCDFYRPRYFLLENVRNFVTHNKSRTFRMVLRTLLDMGYQVRFGVLNAGNFGVAQSRKRTFIWASMPQERLPDWPAPKHAFRSPQLKITLGPDGESYCAIPDVQGAPYRAVTVRDTIGDLPPVGNGHSDPEDAGMDYGGPPVSDFQAAIRGECPRLYDHVSKQMNDLNYTRCRLIPKNMPGADWRALEVWAGRVSEDTCVDEEKNKHPMGTIVPWCLANDTRHRHNQWRGLFGRLDYYGHFPTAVTDPQPMGKVGQVFHPEQDRIITVRECARSQGFPDTFRFYGDVHSRHRQIGNAVPVPLARSLGEQLCRALTRRN
ncbi:unnamed protein product [Pedinophyceae sp. YPF-701]|nr:unnamed protein product [Pedinophyceae sp. YPF-701]